MRIAFYAPLKSPLHPAPSGDRQMARLLMRALERAGHEVVLASEFRAYDSAGDPARQQALQTEGEAEARRALAAMRTAPPDLWFTYHLYHKAPDWLGPLVSAELGIPYVVAEPSHAPKRAGGPWDLGHRASAKAIGQADLVLCLTRHDMACVAPLVAGRCEWLPPFIDAAPFLAAPRAGDGRTLLAVGMFRPGDKLDSYRRLGAALARLDGDWRLVVVGDGPERAAVEGALPRAEFVGEARPEALPALYGAADLYVWPASGEAYGVALLEAQAACLPVVAGRERGVPDVVQDGATGLLVAPGDAAAFAAAARRLLDDGALRREMGRRARAFVAGERNLPSAAARLGGWLSDLRK
jgi:glycosyltransferase involved in cell wall biosynthesis